MSRIGGVSVREGTRGDWNSAVELAWRVFEDYDAADYSPEGKENFRHFLFDTSLKDMFKIGNYRLFVAELYGTLVGMLTLRQRAHISLLFVDGNCHRNGIGADLVRLAAQTVAAEGRGSALSVHASPYAVAFYQKLGFAATGAERMQDGIRFTPMLLQLGQGGNR